MLGPSGSEAPPRLYLDVFGEQFDGFRRPLEGRQLPAQTQRKEAA